MTTLLIMKIAAIALSASALALMLPIPAWQRIIFRVMKKRTRIISAVTAAVLTLILCAAMYRTADVTISLPSSAGEFPVLHATSTPIPTPEPTPVPTPSPDEPRDFVLNTSRMKIHYPDCLSVEEMAEHNRQSVFAAKNDLMDQGYTPCGRCKP